MQLYAGMQFASPTASATATPTQLRPRGEAASQAPARPLSPLGSPLALLLIGAGGLVLGYDQLGSYRTRRRPRPAPDETETP